MATKYPRKVLLVVGYFVDTFYWILSIQELLGYLLASLFVDIQSPESTTLSWILNGDNRETSWNMALVKLEAKIHGYSWILLDLAE